MGGLPATSRTVGLGVAVFLAMTSWGCYSRGTDHTIDELPITDQPSAPHRFAATIHQPFQSLGVTGDEVDSNGDPARIACATCHGLEPGGLAPAGEQFHDRVGHTHGGLACEACHQPPDYSAFRSATGASIEYGQVLELCGQCHGRRLRDYLHGAHGGMTGHWDLDRGPRDRNSCLVCHEPHQPAIPQVMPAPRPRYRFTPSTGLRTGPSTGLRTGPASGGGK